MWENQKKRKREEAEKKREKVERVMMNRGKGHTCLIKQINFFFNILLQWAAIVAHCSWMSKHIAYSTFNVVCFFRIKC